MWTPRFWSRRLWTGRFWPPLGTRVATVTGSAVLTGTGTLSGSGRRIAPAPSLGGIGPRPARPLVVSGRAVLRARGILSGRAPIIVRAGALLHAAGVLLARGRVGAGGRGQGTAIGSLTATATVVVYGATARGSTESRERKARGLIIVDASGFLRATGRLVGDGIEIPELEDLALLLDDEELAAIIVGDEEGMLVGA